MIKDIRLPDLGEGIEGAEVSEVVVDPGDTVTAEDTILVLESDKASMEIPAEVNGTVTDVSVATGDEVKTGQLLIKIEISDSTDAVEEEPIFTEESDVSTINQECTSATRGCVDCKRQLAENLNTYLGPMRERRSELSKRPDDIKDILSQGAKNARKIAQSTIAEVYEKMGLS